MFNTLNEETVRTAFEAAVAQGNWPCKRASLGIGRYQSTYTDMAWQVTVETLRRLQAEASRQGELNV
jgi:hypothetical protein